MKRHNAMTHGMSYTSEYAAWKSMRARCAGRKPKWAKDYVDRGITVCDRWALFANFYADMGPRPEGHSLERKNNDKGYEPDNCKWATPGEQVRNRTNTVMVEIDGVTKCLADWCYERGLPTSTVWMRMKRTGCSPLDALKRK